MSIGVSRELINLGKRNLEKPGIWEILKKKTRKTWNFEQKSLKTLGFWTKITKKPGILNKNQ